MISVLKRNICNLCGKKYRKVYELMQHYQVTHEEGLYECKACNLKLHGMEQMRQHIMRKHALRKTEG